MSLARGKFGIEYNPRQTDNEPSGLGWVLAVIAFVAFVSLVWTLIGRFRDGRAERQMENAEPAVAVTPATSVAASNAVQAVEVPAPVVDQSAYARRPPRLRNLLMRLEEADRRRDLEMAVTTIEAIRALPGSPAADLDDALARRLGTLNVRRLFELKNAQWVGKVTVKRGDSASRIAVEHGSTLASLARLNGGQVDRIVLGQTLYVMDHPRFNLVIHRRTRTADLSLNGKFFKRYDLQGEVRAKEGAYELPERKRAFWGNVGVSLKPSDRDELETLLPAKTPVLISEL